MRIKKYCAVENFILILCLLMMVPSWADIPASQTETDLQYPQKDIDGMLSRLLKEGDKRRIMIKPYKLRFKGQLMAKPEMGDYSLAYDSLQLWSSASLPTISHSSYIQTAAGKVIAVYVEEAVASRLSHENVGLQATFYALHLYNYEYGPRLLILSYQSEAGQLSP